MHPSVPDRQHDSGDYAQEPDLAAGVHPASQEARLFYDRRQRCLHHLLPLALPKIRPTQQRLLRLKKSLSGGSASHNAAVLAKDPHFWDYLQQINLMAFDGEVDTRRAQHFINRVCGVSGRHGLDRQPQAVERYFSCVEAPFLSWLCALT